MALNLASFFDWYNSNLFSKPWLIVGKGPTFDSIHKVNLHDYNVLGLNHVMYRIPCLLGHAIDYDVFTMSERNLLCRHIVTPWEPHINFVPGGVPAPNLFANKDLNIDIPILWYNSDRSKKLMMQSGPVVRVKLFSACAAVNLLANAGVKEIYTVGVDGGKGYSKEFDPKDKLANGRASFDGQTKEFKLASKVFGVSVKPLFEVP
jgi:hypothetical protein